MTDFLIKSTISLTVFLGFYHLVLEREKMHQFNRFYLLFSIIISLVIPFLTFEIIRTVPVVQQINSLVKVNSASIKVITSQEADYKSYFLWCLYGLISFLLLFRFVKNIVAFRSKTKVNPTIKYKNANLVLVQEKTLPHTFLNYIFINNEDYNNRKIEEELYTHEIVHVTQKHTLDILFIELLKTVFWFHPLFYFYKKAIQLNHEFLADEEIVKTYNNVPAYQNLLLQKSSGNQTIYLASNLNYLVTKKRLIMMTKNTSQKIALLKKVAIVPILAGLIYFFCIEIVAQEKFSISKQLSKLEEREQKKTEETISKTNLTLNDTVKKKKIETSKKTLEKITINGEIFEKSEEKYFNERGSFDKTGKNKYRDGYIKINNETHFYVTDDNGKTEYFNKNGVSVNQNGEEINNKSKPINRIDTKNPENDVYNTSELSEKPDFEYGIEAFYKFVAVNLIIPDEVAIKKLNGKVFAKFIIEKDGSLTNIEIIRDMGYGTGKEVMRVLKKCPKWKPGKIKEEIVRTQYSLPISIQSAK